MSVPTGLQWYGPPSAGP